MNACHVSKIWVDIREELILELDESRNTVSLAKKIIAIENLFSSEPDKQKLKNASHFILLCCTAFEDFKSVPRYVSYCKPVRGVPRAIKTERKGFKTAERCSETFLQNRRVN